MHKEALSALAIALAFIAFIPYIRSIRREQTRPHVFSWVVWGTTTLIVFMAQLAAGGGAGSWPTGVNGAVTMYIAFLAYRKKSDISITRADRLMFLAAMGCLPLWYLTSDPLWAVVVLTAVDTLGFGPTVRKAYSQPFEENLTFFSIFVATNLLIIAALERYSLTTVLFPATISATTLALVIMAFFRRRILLKKD